MNDDDVKSMIDLVNNYCDEVENDPSFTNPTFRFYDSLKFHLSKDKNLIVHNFSDETIRIITLHLISQISNIRDVNEESMNKLCIATARGFGIVINRLGITTKDGALALASLKFNIEI